MDSNKFWRGILVFPPFVFIGNVFVCNWRCICIAKKGYEFASFMSWINKPSSPSIFICRIMLKTQVDGKNKL